MMTGIFDTLRGIADDHDLEAFALAALPLIKKTADVVVPEHTSQPRGILLTPKVPQWFKSPPPPRFPWYGLGAVAVAGALVYFGVHSLASKEVPFFDELDAQLEAAKRRIYAKLLQIYYGFSSWYANDLAGLDSHGKLPRQALPTQADTPLRETMASATASSQVNMYWARIGRDRKAERLITDDIDTLFKTRHWKEKDYLELLINIATKVGLHLSHGFENVAIRYRAKILVLNAIVQGKLGKILQAIVDDVPEEEFPNIKRYLNGAPKGEAAAEASSRTASLDLERIQEGHNHAVYEALTYLNDGQGFSFGSAPERAVHIDNIPGLRPVAPLHGSFKVRNGIVYVVNAPDQDVWVHRTAAALFPDIKLQGRYLQLQEGDELWLNDHQRSQGGLCFFKMNDNRYRYHVFLRKTRDEFSKAVSQLKDSRQSRGGAAPGGSVMSFSSDVAEPRRNPHPIHVRVPNKTLDVRGVLNYRDGQLFLVMEWGLAYVNGQRILPYSPMTGTPVPPDAEIWLEAMDSVKRILIKRREDRWQPSVPPPPPPDRVATIDEATARRYLVIASDRSVQELYIGAEAVFKASRGIRVEAKQRQVTLDPSQLENLGHYLATRALRLLSTMTTQSLSEANVCKECRTILIALQHQDRDGTDEQRKLVTAIYSFLGEWEMYRKGKAKVAVGKTPAAKEVEAGASAGTAAGKSGALLIPTALKRVLVEEVSAYCDSLLEFSRLLSDAGIDPNHVQFEASLYDTIHRFVDDCLADRSGQKRFEAFLNEVLRESSGHEHNFMNAAIHAVLHRLREIKE